MSVNPFGVNLLPENDEGEEVCVICQDTLAGPPTYTLPECGHTYHTHCIVTWFRHRPSTEDYNGPDGRCPMCGNQGINHVSRRASRRRPWKRGCPDEADKARFRLIMKEARKSDAPQELTKLINKHTAAKESLATAQAELKALKDKIKNENVNFAETNAQMRKLRIAYWDKEHLVRSTHQAITSFPIVPIIIPTPIDIN